MSYQPMQPQPSRPSVSDQYQQHLQSMPMPPGYTSSQSMHYQSQHMSSQPNYQSQQLQPMPLPDPPNFYPTRIPVNCARNCLILGSLCHFSDKEYQSKTQLALLTDFNAFLKVQQTANQFPTDSILPMVQRGLPQAQSGPEPGPQVIGPNPGAQSSGSSNLPSPETSQLSRMQQRISKAEEQRKHMYLFKHCMMVEAEAVGLEVEGRIYEKLKVMLNNQGNVIHESWRDDEDDDSSAASTNPTPAPAPAPTVAPNQPSQPINAPTSTAPQAPPQATPPAPQPQTFQPNDPLVQARNAEFNEFNIRKRKLDEFYNQSVKRVKIINRMIAETSTTLQEPAPAPKRTRCRSR